MGKIKTENIFSAENDTEASTTNYNFIFFQYSVCPSFALVKTFILFRRPAFSFSKKSAEIIFHTSEVQSWKLVAFRASYDPNTFSDVEVWTLGCPVYCSENKSNVFVWCADFLVVSSLFFRSKTRVWLSSLKE